MRHASDCVVGKGPGGTHRVEALAIGPVVVGKHPKKIFGVHRVSSAETPCERGPAGALRLAALRRYDDRHHDHKWCDGEHGFMTSLFPRSAFPAPLLVTTLLLCLSCLATQAQNQTQAQTRQQLLQDLDSGQLRDAVLLGQQAVSRWPRDAQFRHYLGVAYFKTGDPKQAQEQLTRARELNPKDSATHFDLALLLLSQQDYPEAAKELEAPIKLRTSTVDAKTNAFAHMLLGRAYLNSNRSLQAIDEFKTALKLDPEIKLGHYHLGFAYFSLGRNDEAIGEYEEELRRSGESPAAVYELGRSLLESGKYEAALKYLQRGTELDAANPDVWYNMGQAQQRARHT